MKIRIIKFFSTKIVARYYVDLGNVSISETKEILNEIMLSDSKSKYITSSEYLFYFKDKFGYEISYQKELTFPHNVKRCNENLDEIWQFLQDLQKRIALEKCIVLEISRKK